MKQLARFKLENPRRRRFLQAAAIAGGGFAIGMGPFMRANAPAAAAPAVLPGPDIWAAPAGR